MSLTLEKSPPFRIDATDQFAWYYEKAGENVARRFVDAVDSTILQLAKHPDLGSIRKFKHPKLLGLRSFRVAPPFDKLLIFYRVMGNTLYVWRLMHGSRDFQRRLTEPPGS